MNTISRYFAEVAHQLAAIDSADAERMVELLWECHERGARLALCGNGGSASTASHLVADLQKNLFLAAGKRRWEVISLCDSIPLLTAWSNDTEYANVFAGQARCWLRPGDVLVAISGSGNSSNVLAAVEASHALGAITIGLCGYGGGKLAKTAQHSVVIHSNDMQVVEDVHLSLLHAVFRELLQRLHASK
jgi:D-sedoheptulose 7-phosphate isomerase